VFDASVNAFNNPAANLSAERSRAFFTGNSFFRQNWVIAPASTEGRDGLGPLFNARSCGGCHALDGRAKPPAGPADDFEGLLIRLSLPGVSSTGGPIPTPNYGGQLNNFAIPGVRPEARPSVRYEELAGAFEDGSPYSLRKPVYSFTQAHYGSLEGVLFSPRIAQPVIGLGLLEAIDEATLLERADPDDRDGDGISGRPNYVWDKVHQRRVLGRFGWKANQPNLRQQTADAFLGDLGITSSINPVENCTSVQTDCAAAPHGGTPELSDTLLDRVVFYTHFLAVPGRRNAKDPTVLAGKKLFVRLGCATCHRQTFRTGTLPGLPELSNQTIYPYTDLLLHDMGPELADNRPDFEASGTEWRTPPLWGISLAEVVNGHSFLLHDGRARNLNEAILWHSGEGAASRDSYKKLSATEREQLITFLRSL
jgi:CxxC motif-containing protein (DUF1111 family)